MSGVTRERLLASHGNNHAAADANANARRDMLSSFARVIRQDARALAVAVVFSRANPGAIHVGTALAAPIANATAYDGIGVSIRANPSATYAGAARVALAASTTACNAP